MIPNIVVLGVLSCLVFMPALAAQVMWERPCSGMRTTMAHMDTVTKRPTTPASQQPNRSKGLNEPFLSKAIHGREPYRQEPQKCHANTWRQPNRTNILKKATWSTDPGLELGAQCSYPAQGSPKVQGHRPFGGRAPWPTHGVDQTNTNKNQATRQNQCMGQRGITCLSLVAKGLRPKGRKPQKVRAARFKYKESQTKCVRSKGESNPQHPTQPPAQTRLKVEGDIPQETRRPKIKQE